MVVRDLATITKGVTKVKVKGKAKAKAKDAGEEVEVQKGRR